MLLPRPHSEPLVLLLALTIFLGACDQSAPPSAPSSTPIATATVPGTRPVPDSLVLDRWIDSSGDSPQYCVRLEFPLGAERDHCGEGEHFRICHDAALIGKEAPMICVT